MDIPKSGDRRDNIDIAWRSVVDSAGPKEFRLKDLRHTFCRWLAIEGVEYLQIGDLMGHKEVKTTQVYAHLCIRKKEQSTLAVFS